MAIVLPNIWKMYFHVFHWSPGIWIGGNFSRKYGRTRYWQSKFRHLSPFEVPVELPKDAHALAVHAIKQITSKDPTTDVKTYDTDEENLDNDTWIVSGMSPKQIELLSKWPAVSTY